MDALTFKVERSRSRRGKHVLYSALFVYDKEEGLLPYTKAKVRYSEQQTKATYSRGEAKSVVVELERGDYAIYAWFVKNFKNKVKGYISVYNYKGELVYRAKYLDGYLVRSKGDPIYAWLVRLFISSQKIPITGMKLGDESERAARTSR
ncbi:MAG: hypothetical protein ACP5KA_01005 [Desulfurococcaceae archaeon]